MQFREDLQLQLQLRLRVRERHGVPVRLPALRVQLRHDQELQLREQEADDPELRVQLRL